MASEYVSRKRPAAVNLAKYRETLSWRGLYSKTQFAAMNDAYNVALGSFSSDRHGADARGMSASPPRASKRCHLSETMPRAISDLHAPKQRRLYLIASP